MASREMVKSNPRNETRRHHRHRAGHGFSAELVLKDSSLLEEPEGLQRGILVNLADGDAHVDDRVVADLDLGDVCETNLLDDTAEVHTARS